MLKDSLISGGKNVVFSHLLRSEDGFSVSEAAGRGDRKAAFAEVKVRELHSYLGRHFYDQHRPHPRGGLGCLGEGRIRFSCPPTGKTYSPSAEAAAAAAEATGMAMGSEEVWFKNIGFLFPPVLSHKMSAWMRMKYLAYVNLSSSVYYFHVSENVPLPGELFRATVNRHVEDEPTKEGAEERR